MSVNNTSCSPTGNCTIIDGATTNGTFYVQQYDPSAPVVDAWRPKLELATICICNSLTLIVIVARLCYRWGKFRRFRADDKWMVLAGVFLIAYTYSQIGANHYGSGLHFINIPETWRKLHWQYGLGWCGYWLVTTCIKLSACCVFLGILPKYMKGLRYSTFALCAVISSLGLIMLFSWLFTCQPIASNFVWSVNATSCLNYDIFRWLWIGVSFPIDIIIMYIPLQILRRAHLRSHEQRILKLVFSATLLGTIVLIIGIYGAYSMRTANANDGFYEETPWIMMNDIEILMYTFGASFPVLSNYIIQLTDRGPEPGHANFSSWARYIPNFFTSNAPATVLRHSTHQAPSIGQHSSIKPLTTAPSSLHTVPSGGDTERHFEMSSTHRSRSDRSGSLLDPDLEKADGTQVHVHAEVGVERDGRELVGNYITSTDIIEPGR